MLDHGANIHAVHSVARGGSHGLWALDLQAVDLAIWGSNTCAAPKRDFETARLLVARGAAYDLTIAAALGDVQRVRALLDEDPSRIREKRPNGKRPLSAAVEFGHEALARVLLARGADPRKGTALPAAASTGDGALVELLLAHLSLIHI